jgi:hypothetical protein
MRNKLFWVIVFSLITFITSSTHAFDGEPTDPLEGEWVFDISGNDKGVVIITFLSNFTFEGYGLTLDTEVPLLINGSYEIDIKGKIYGTLTVKDWETEEVLGSWNFTGKINTKRTKLNLKILDIPIILNGVRLPDEPDIPENWTVKITGEVKGIINPLNIKPMESEGGRIFKRTYRIFGAITLQNNESFIIEGGFILNQKNVAYGIYEVLLPDTNGTKIDFGVFSGKITLPSGKFNWKAESSVDGSKFNLKGEIIY